jgi:catechol 2,3-dioxygenase-like lactoylglutathione lyase family enzyme
MRIARTHHVAITTPDIARLRAFYVGTLGFPVVGGFPGHAIVFIAAGDTTIELIEEERPAGGGQRGWNHLAWEVADVDAAYAELSARGVTFRTPPEGFPAGAPSMRVAFFEDPDGNLLELIQPLGDRYPPAAEPDRLDPPGEVTGGPGRMRRPDGTISGKPRRAEWS